MQPTNNLSSPQHVANRWHLRALAPLVIAAALFSTACPDTVLPPQTVALTGWELEAGHSGFSSDAYPTDNGISGAACFTVVSPCSDPTQQYLDGVVVSGGGDNPRKVELTIDPQLSPRARNTGVVGSTWSANSFLSTTERGLNNWCTGTWKVVLPYPESEGPMDEAQGDLACSEAYDSANIEMTIDWDSDQKTGGFLKAANQAGSQSSERLFACESGEAVARLQPYGPASLPNPSGQVRAYPLILEGMQDTVGAELTRVRLLDAPHHEVELHTAGGERLPLNRQQGWVDVPAGLSVNDAWRLQGDTKSHGHGLPRVAMAWQCGERRLDPLPQGYRFTLPGVAQEVIVRLATNRVDQPVVIFEPRGKPGLLTGLVAIPDGTGGYRIRGGIAGMALDANIRLDNQRMQFSGELELAEEVYVIEEVGTLF